MIVVSDATPIISLAKIEMLNILESLFNEVVLPTAVIEEVSRNLSYSKEAVTIKSSPFIKEQTVENKQAVKILMASGLDLGESEAIVLSDSLPDALLLMDERKGRQK